MATQVLQFNQAQQAVLNVISCLQSEQDLADLKRTLVKFMNDRLQREIDKLWESGELSNEKLQIIIDTPKILRRIFLFCKKIGG